MSLFISQLFKIKATLFWEAAAITFFLFLPISHMLHPGVLLTSVVFLFLLLPRLDQNMDQAKKFATYSWWLFGLFLLGVQVYSSDFGPQIMAVEYLLFVAVAAVICIRIFRLLGPSTPLIIFLCLAALQGQIALLQFTLQRDIGLYLLGEPVLRIGEAGVATFSAWADDKVLRAYGFFQHPNILGGFLTMISALFFGSWLSWRNPQKPTLSSRDTLLAFAGLGYFLFVGILLSFSRSAYLAFFMAMFLVMILGYKSLGPLFRKSKNLVVRLSLPFVITALLFFPLFHERFTDSADRGYSERALGFQWAVSIWHEANPWFGIGIGQYENVLGTYLINNHVTHFPWQIEPLHSVPFLFLLELGISGYALGIALVWFIWKERQYRNHRASSSLIFFIPFLPLIFFDHYIWTDPFAMLWTIVIGYFLLFPDFPKIATKARVSPVPQPR